MIDLGEIEFGIMSKLIRQQITHHFAPNWKSIRHKRKSFWSRNNSEMTVNVHDRRSLLHLNGCQMNPFKIFFVMLHSTRMNRGRKGGFRLMAEDFCTSKNQWYV